MHTGRKLRWVELEFSVSRTNLGKKHTGLNPALLPRCFLCLYLPGNSSGFKKPSIQWEEVTPGRTRDFSSQHKPGLEITWQQPSACAQVVPVPGFTRHYTSTMPPGNSRRRSCSWGLPGASRGVLQTATPCIIPYPAPLPCPHSLASFTTLAVHQPWVGTSHPSRVCVWVPARVRKHH